MFTHMSGNTSLLTFGHTTGHKLKSLEVKSSVCPTPPSHPTVDTLGVRTGCRHRTDWERLPYQLRVKSDLNV